MQKPLTLAAAAVAVAALLLPAAPAAAQTADTSCSTVLRAVSSISTSMQRIAGGDFVGTGGMLEPLLSTRVSVTGTTGSCLLVHVSALAVPQDNHIIFQLLVDGLPAPGQSAFPSVPGVPVFYDPEETNLNLGRMVAHTFAVPVAPGPHLVELKFAGCCSVNTPNNSGVVNAATLTVQYR